MIKSNQEKKEEILKKLEDLNKKGVKLVKKNLDEIDPTLYATAEELFGGWMEAKKAFYDYMEMTKNPEKNLQRILVKKVEELQENIDIPVSKNQKINPEFIKYVEKNDIFLKSIILNTFVSWDNFFRIFNELSTPVIPEFSEDELAKGLAMAIKSDHIIQENIVAEKYTDIYNALIREYGSFESGILHFLLTNV